ncbi:MAG: hypothetical protein ACK5NX_00385 [Armatimonadota bacterium]
MKALADAAREGGLDF